MKSKMLIFAFIVSCLLLAHNNTMGQARAAPTKNLTDTITAKNWEIGAFITKNWETDTGISKSILLRRNYLNKNGMPRAWRLRLTIGVDRASDYIFSDELYYITNSYSLGIAGGQEWQKKVNKFCFYTGYEVYALYENRYTLARIGVNASDSLVQVECYNAIKIGVNGFVGIKYNINKNIVFGIESPYLGTRFSYQDAKLNLCYDGPFNSSDPSQGDGDGDFFKTKVYLFPAVSFNLNYHFSTFKKQRNERF